MWVRLHHQGTAGFSPYFHLPGFRFGYILIFDPQPCMWLHVAMAADRGCSRKLVFQVPDAMLVVDVGASKGMCFKSLGWFK